MIRNYWNEQWKPVVFDEKIADTEKYKVSNYGRLIKCQSFREVLVKEFFINGYQTIPLKQKANGKSTSRYVHKLVAQHFLEQGDGIYVIHLNYDKKDNKVENLKWATKKEKENHQFTNPEYLNRPKKRTYSKLTEAKVRLIKRKIHDPNRRTRMKMIAKQFGISEMQLYRIKSGENWGTVTDY
ncbi:HNH endonuclease [Psychroflexus gondwanensis]|jgi:DNA-binding phage protein|uniref:HNH homing endonuclease n=1 Tax=Psychroflexus gondwanensis ACAM 44 TaxID=1189619 RepID=N1WWQ0_9FLAO|nr:HNH endonuclease [Psychroflexus gondwanensis]EMY80283.1 HNH homing endonuclease [Psychroflexus gondwanensis ACAM 44]TXE17712.1 HNH endonuclease [Psychroflexus gondwanensis]